MTEVSAFNPAIETGQVAIDLPCRRCGYNLRGLREEGRCPECGAEVAASLRGDLLRFADPVWVRRVALGTSIMLGTMVVRALIPCVTRGVEFGFVIGSAASSQSLMVVSRWITYLAAAATAAAGVYGVWLVTGPDLGEQHDRARRTRRFVRAAFLAKVGAIGVSLLPGLTREFAAEFQLISYGLALFAASGEFVLFGCYARLAERIPEAKIAGRARFLQWTFPPTVLLLVTFSGLFSILVAMRSMTLLGMLSCFRLPMELLLTVFAMLAAGMLTRLGRSLREQARIGQALWESNSQGRDA